MNTREYNITIGQNLKELRITNTEYNQQQIARLLNYSNDMYRKIELGQTSLTTDKLIKLCTILKCTPNNILKGTY